MSIDLLFQLDSSAFLKHFLDVNFSVVQELTIVLEAVGASTKLFSGVRFEAVPAGVISQMFFNKRFVGISSL